MLQYKIDYIMFSFLLTDRRKYFILLFNAFYVRAKYIFFFHVNTGCILLQNVYFFYLTVFSFHRDANI
jgi:hypothetical protein